MTKSKLNEIIGTMERLAKPSDPTDVHAFERGYMMAVEHFKQRLLNDW